MQDVRVRIAPSPTGEDLHIGHANTALVSYIFAKQHNGKFIVRIEDTDQTRYVAGSVQRIIDSLRWLGIDFDEGPSVGGGVGPYIQSQRLNIYHKHVQMLVESGKAYYCFCTPELVVQMRAEQERLGWPSMYDGRCKHLSTDEVESRLKRGDDHVVRLNVPDDGQTQFVDMIRGEIKFENNLIDDQVLLKSDGYPTYHLAVVVDDHLMKISHVIRGEDWISSTPKHVLLYQAFGWELPKFAHLPLLRNKDRSKLSKRKNPVWMSWYREQGFLSEAIVNYLGTLLMPSANGDEVFGIDELVKGFDLKKVNSTGPAWDQDKLTWLNGIYIRQLSISKLTDLLVAGEFIPDEIASNREYLEKVVGLAQDRLKLLSGFWLQNKFFFIREDVSEKLWGKYITDPEIRNKFIELVNEFFAKADFDWSVTEIELGLRKIQGRLRLKPKEAFMTLRVIISGQEATPSLFETIELLGKTEIIARLQWIQESNV